MAPDSQSPRYVRFGLYEADLAAGELRKNGAKIKLQDRPFEILKIFLGRPGEIISRDEFRQSLWPADTFVDFDHSLNASINKLRQALDDDPDNPRFIATAGRKGYRFIAPVGHAAPASAATVPEPPQAAALLSTVGQVEPALPPEAIAPKKTGAWYGAIGVGIIVFGAIGVWLLLRPRAKPALTENDFILISDFVNTTGEPIFDDSLKQALTVKLSESPFFNVEPDMKVKQQLGMMGHSSNDRVVFPTDREVCERLGAKALVAGSIVSVGNKYELDLQAQDCLKGSVLAHQKAAVENRDQVLAAMGKLIPQIRSTLGESLGSIQKFDTPIEQATTSSLAALKAYTEGDKKRQQGNETDSIPFYKLAIELDPNFAVAHVRLGAAYSNSQDYASAEGYLKKAFGKSERVTEREKLYITAHYYVDSTREIEKAIQTYELWRQIYPRDWIPANNLGNEYTHVGRLDKAVEAGQAALRLNPAHIFPYVVLARAYKRSGRFAETKAVCEKAVAANLDSVELHDLLYEIAFAEADQAAMQRELDWSKGKPGEERILYDAAWAATATGRVKLGRSLFQKARDRTLANDFKEYAAATAVDEAQFNAEFGNSAQAQASVALAHRLAEMSEERRAESALPLARAGDSARAEQIERDLSKRFPLNTMLNKVELAEVRAAVALNRNDPAVAIKELESAIPYDLGSPPDLWTMYHRGLAYLHLKSASEAAAEFQRLLDHQCIATASPAVPLARLGLARAYALTGDAAKSRSAYEDFFARWKDADSDIPILIKAKTEYAKLSAR